MRNRLYGGVRGRKMKVGGNYFIFLLLDLCAFDHIFTPYIYSLQMLFVFFSVKFKGFRYFYIFAIDHNL
jgi:hypothetical protein